MRRRTLFKKDSGLLNGNLADAVFYDSNSDSFVTMSPNEITDVIDGYTPIGVVVIPAEHDVYGTGECGVISLVEMNSYTPDAGSSEYEGICWGGHSTDTSLSNYNLVNYIGNNGVVQGTNRYAYLPSDQFPALPIPGLDGKSNYSSNSDSRYRAPSPYNVDGSRNEAYYTTAYSTANTLSDFDGVGNTKVLTDLATAQSDWKTATTITNGYSAGYYPAACCCWRFHTAGTDQGQWYLPAAGELGYVINRISAINETINKVLSVYSSIVAVAVNTDGDYLSSSEESGVGACGLNTSNGYVYTNGAKSTYEFSVRAFLCV